MTLIAGHRGMGCTDSAFAQSRNGDAAIPLENTISSFCRALPIADYIETDLIRTKDNHIVLTHSTDYAQHVAPERRPDTAARFIADMPLAEVQDLKLGADGNRKIPTLRQLLRLTKMIGYLNLVQLDKSIALNLELKDVQGTICTRKTSPNMSELVLHEVEEAGFPLDCIRFSSFSLDSIAEMAAASGGSARLGMLFDVPKGKGGDVGKQIFADSAETYRGFTRREIDTVLRRVPGVEALHPEIRTLTAETVKCAADHRLKIATWAWQENSPEQDRKAAYSLIKAMDLCSRQGVRLEIITDHIKAVRKLEREYWELRFPMPPPGYR